MVNAAFDAKQWEELRREARKLESELDDKLLAFSKHGAALGVGLSIAPDVSQGMSDEIQELLMRLSEVNDAMSRCVTSASGAANPSMMHTVQRHREILHGFAQECKKTRSNIAMYREHAQLLSTVQRESPYKQQMAGFGSNGENLLRERQGLTSIERITDTVINQALATRENLANQRRIFMNVTWKLKDLNFTTIGKTIDAISRKKKRDVIVLSSVIGICLVLILLYKSTA